MLTAITRKVSSSLANCELSFIDRNRLILKRARAQHHAYEALIEKLSAKVISLPEEKELPDSMFVEDPAIVLDEVAIICPLGTETRRKEAPSLAAALEPFRKLAYIKLPGMLEGGDVLRIGKKIYVGLTHRSNCRRHTAVGGDHRTPWLRLDGRAGDGVPAPEVRLDVSRQEYAPRQPRVVPLEAVRRIRLGGCGSRGASRRKCAGNWQIHRFPRIVSENPRAN